MITWTLGNATEQFFSPLEGRFELSVVIKFELMASTWIIRKTLIYDASVHIVSP